MKSFSGAKTRYIQDYVKPTLRENLDQIIVYVGTIDFASNKRQINVVSKLQRQLLTSPLLQIHMMPEANLGLLQHRRWSAL